MGFVRVRRLVPAVLVAVMVATSAVAVASTSEEDRLPPEAFTPTNVPGLAVAVDGLDLTSVDTTSINLGSVRVGLPEVSAALGLPSYEQGMHSVGRVFLSNTGTDPMTVTGVVGTGSSDFVNNYTFPDGHVLAPGNQVSVKVGFQPSSEGSKSGGLQIQTSAGNFNISLQGRGVGGSVLYRIGSGGTGVVPVDGGNSPSFTEDRQANESTYFHISPGGSSTTPSLPRPIVTSHPSLPGGTPPAMLGTLRKSGTYSTILGYDFPVLAPGAHLVRLYFADSQLSAARLFDVYAEGSRVLQNFSISDAAGGIDIGVARAFVVNSNQILNVELRNNNAQGVEASKLSGIEVIQVSSAKAAAGSVDFGPVVVGAEVTRELTLRNTGGPSDPAFRVDGVAVSGPGASDLTHGFSGSSWLAPGESLVVPLTMKPSTQGDHSATATFSIWGGLEATAAISGSGVVPQGTLNAPASVTFDPVRAGSVATEAVTLSNPSGTAIFVAGVELNGPDVFTVDQAVFPLTVPAGASRSLTVNFSPESAGSASATLRIEHSGTNRPSNVALSGTALSRFTDTGGSVFEDDIDWLAASGITRGCNPPANDRFCPDDRVTRGQMAAFFVRALGLEGTGSGFTDTVGHVFDGDIRRLAAAEVTRGCNPPANDRFCPDDFVTRGQMAAFFVRGLGLSEDGSGFSDTVGHIFDGDIRRLAEAGITRGCNPPSNTRFCPDDHVTRGQMAAFFHRAAALMGLSG